MSEKKSKTASSQRKTKKHHTVLPYIKTPILFVLISLVMVLPLSLGLLRVAVNTVHSAQSTLTRTYSDLQTDSSGYAASDKQFGSATFNRPSVGSQVGVLRCDDAGLETAVYFGLNRVSYRGGVGVAAKQSLPGEGGEIRMAGNAATGFKALFNIKTDDILTFETGWGTYEYKVTEVKTAKSVSPATQGEVLILSTAKDKKAFSYYDDEKRYVVAEYLSGPSAKEVQE